MADKSDVTYEVIPDARNHQNKPNKEPPPKEYKVMASDFFSNKVRDHELAEFRLMQDKSLFSDYLEWGEHEVRYTDMASDEKVKRLQQRNDAYTMTMLMSCIGPLRQGITPSALIQVWTSYQVISTFNENMDVDVSRMCSNIRQDLERMRTSFESKGPLAKFAFNAISGFLDDYLNATAGDKMSNSVNEAMAHDTIDELVMTPKQVAALKVSFMEQYYVDLRSGEHTEAYLTRRYNRAIGHLGAIAHNSGFDMSVVAAEERHIVGLKIGENAGYANVFNETCGIYGAKPCLQEDGKWSDAFITADDHSYTVGGHPETGAFTVRLPVRDDGMDDMGSSGTYESCLTDAVLTAKEFGGMMSWVDSEDCPFSEKDKKFIRSELEDLREQHVYELQKQMEDDGLGAYAQDVRKRFDAYYKMALDGGMDSQYGEAIGTEVKHIVDKEVMTRMGLNHKDEILALLANRDPALLNTEDFMKLKQFDEKAATTHGDVSNRNAIEILEDARLNFIEQMSPSEIVKLMLHAGANTHQGMLERGSVFRPGYEPIHRGPESMVMERDEVEVPFSMGDPEDHGEEPSPVEDEYMSPV